MKEGQIVRYFGEEKPALEDLAHFGVKGMKWGIRKEQFEISSDTKKKLKTAAVVLGSAAVAAVVIAGALHLKDHDFGDTKTADIHVPESAVKFTKSLAKEPVGLIHAARGKHRGFQFPQRGGLGDPIRAYEEARFETLKKNSFHRYGDKQEKIAAVFDDPDGRLDRAGRPIHHEVILPESMTDGISSIDDVVRTVWPKIKDTYSVLYDKPTRDST